MSPSKKDDIESVTERQLAHYKEGSENNFSASGKKYITHATSDPSKDFNNTGNFKLLDSAGADDKRVSNSLYNPGRNYTDGSQRS